MCLFSTIIFFFSSTASAAVSITGSYDGNAITVLGNYCHLATSTPGNRCTTVNIKSGYTIVGSTNGIPNCQTKSYSGNISIGNAKVSNIIVESLGIDDYGVFNVNGSSFTVSSVMGACQETSKVNTAYLMSGIGASNSISISATATLVGAGQSEGLLQIHYDPYIMDYGHAPDATAGSALANYKTRSADGGPSHYDLESKFNVYLGTTPANDDAGTTQNAMASADTQEDGTTFNGWDKDLTSFSTNVTVTNKRTTPAYLYAWIDFDKNGIFEVDESIDLSQITVPASTTNASIVLNWPSFVVQNKGVPAYARLRISSTQLTTTASGHAEDTRSIGAVNSAGEVEDYILLDSYDYGDLNDTAVGTGANNYRTSYEDNGPRHGKSPNLYVGSLAADIEPDATDNLTATGDNTTGQNDESGVILPPLSVSTTSYKIRVPATNNLAQTATLHAWIDWNKNGAFEAAEYQGTSISANSNANHDLTFTPSATITNASNYAVRVRVTTDTLTDNVVTTAEDERSYGIANDGEVEDYIITAASSYDFGDLPDTYQTFALNGGPYHAYDSTLYLGSVANSAATQWDGESDGQPSATGKADADDLAGTTPDDEGSNPGSIIALPIPTTGTNYSLKANFYAWANNNASAQVRAWIDWNKDGKFTANEASATGSTGVTATTLQQVTLNWTGLDLSTLSQGDQLALRVRLTTDALSDTSWGGAASDGEVEDHRLFVGNVDYGDAPDTTATTSAGNYQTLFENGGPGHGLRAGLKIGATAADADASINAPLHTTYTSVANNATLGDNATGMDEDIIPSLSNPDFAVPATGATSYSLRIPVTNTTGSTAYLVGWYDANNDGDFADAGEQSSIATVSADGTYMLSWTGLANTNTTIPQKAVRLRLSTDTTLNTAPSPNGLLADGEVEDMLVYNTNMLSGYVYQDSDNSLTHGATETDIANISVHLYADTNGDRILQASEATTPLSTAITAADGYYRLIPPANGNYFIVVDTTDTDLPLNYSYTGTGNGMVGNTTATTVAAATTTTNNNPIAITYLSTANQTNKDFPFNALDFGDAPDSYGTNKTNSSAEGIGASHTLGLSAWIGNTAPDADADGQPNAAATGDNGTGTDDEGGLVLPAISTQASTYSIQVRAVNQSTTAMYLAGWLDRNGNGQFDDSITGNGAADESARATVAANSDGYYTLTWTGLSGLTGTQTYLRLRLSNDSTPDPTGVATYGEVEDHVVAIDNGPQACGAQEKLDVVFLMDNGTNITATEYTAIQSTLNKTIDAFATSGADVQVAVAQYTGTGTTAKLDIRQGFIAAGTAAKAWIQGSQNLATGNLSEAFLTLKNALDGHPDTKISGVTTTLTRRPDAKLVVLYVTDATNATYLGNTAYTGSNILKSAPYSATLVGWHASTTVTNNQYAAANASVGGSYASTLAANVGDPEGSARAPRRLLTALTTAIPDGLGDALANYSCLSIQDYGDAPDTAVGTAVNNYATTLLDNGPRHTVSNDLYFGAGMPDPDADGQQNATGDDTVGSDDEDGVVLPQLSTTSTSYSIQVSTTNTTGSVAQVYAWVDWNRNGALEASEAQTAIVPDGSTAKTGVFTWTPPTAPVNNTVYYVRVRITTDLLTDTVGTTTVDERSIGSASDGEIEDHAITASSLALDFGDLPDTYQTLALSGGPYHAYDSTLYLGSVANSAATQWDGESDGQLSTIGKADADDLAGTDDEGSNPGSIIALLIPTKGSSYSLKASFYATANNNASAQVRAWIDWNKDGKFTANEASTLGSTGVAATTLQQVTLNWTGLDLSTLDQGDQLALRVRLSTDTLSDTSWGGGATDGEVEDHMLLVGDFDYGDAPDTTAATGLDNYQTSFENNGPRHGVSNTLYLGSQVPDADMGGQPGTLAKGDDAAGLDDEDGVMLPPLTTTSTAYTSRVSIFNQSGQPATVYAWIDWNRNGSFEASELQTATVNSAATAQSIDLTWATLPITPVSGRSYFMRVRTTTDALADTAGTTTVDERSLGAASDGEVEDHVLIATSLTQADYGDLPDSFGTTALNGGPYHLLDINLYIGNVPGSSATQWDAEANGTPSATDMADQDDLTGTLPDDEAEAAITALPVAGDATAYSIQVQYYAYTGNAAHKLRAWLDFNLDGKFSPDEASTVGGTGLIPNALQTVTLEWPDLSGFTLRKGKAALRVRLTTDDLTASDWGGYASDGEVEDHRVTIEQDLVPIAQADSFVAQEDTLLQGNVLSDNGQGTDNDPEGNTLSVNTTPLVAPTKGILTLRADGSFDYVPQSNFHGTDTFTYEVSDGVHTSTAVVTLTIAPVNDSPELTSHSAASTVTISLQEEGITAVTTVQASDIDGDTLTYSLVAGDDSARFSIDPNTGVVSFIQAPDYENPRDTGADNQYTVAVNVTDGKGGTVTQTLLITVTNKAGTQLQVSALLQGPYNMTAGLMVDSLRTKQHLPTTQPYGVAPFNYTGTDSIAPAVLERTGAQAVVDWVLLELRDATDPTVVIAQMAGLLQRDGVAVVAGSGSPTFELENLTPANYFVSVRHRNHLGVMTLNPLNFATGLQVVDFRLPATATYGDHARLANNTLALLWAGDSNQDGRVVAYGPSNDTTVIISDVLTAPDNLGFNSNYLFNGYRASDINLDGVTIFSGPDNDVNLLIGNVLLHPGNALFSANYIIRGGLPVQPQ